MGTMTKNSVGGASNKDSAEKETVFKNIGQEPRKETFVPVREKSGGICSTNCYVIESIEECKQAVDELGIVSIGEALVISSEGSGHGCHIKHDSNNKIVVNAGNGNPIDSEPPICMCP